VKTTCWGIAHAAGGVSRTYNRSGRLEDAHMIRKLELDLPAPGLTVTLGHDDTAPVVGEVVYAELDRDDRLNVVSVVDDDWTDVDEDVFYSGEFDCRSRSDLGGSVWIADRAYLIGMALTASPASFEARPLKFMPGDIRESIDRFGWPCSWRWSSPLLERALEHTPRGETRARRIVGPPPKIEQVGGDAWLVNGELVARTGRPAGRVRYWPPAGDGSSILSVR
jgi:hypothetical protein